MTKIIDNLKTWIDKGGFPFEMQVANAFIKAGFDVVQSIYYKDLETEKFRETDIIATYSKSVNNIWVNLTFVIECKKSNDKPWIVLINSGLKDYDNQLPVYATHTANDFLQRVNNQDMYKSDLLFKNSREIGYSVVTAFNSGKDKSYESIQSLTKACEYFMSECNSRRKHHCNIYIPTIIVDGKLYNATLTKKGEMQIENVKQSAILVQRSFHSFGNANLLIFDSSDIEKTANHLYDQFNDIFEKYSDLF